ncbi:hypothetical protein J6590_010550 [Homalodisca vitripennis]|nr:hypothetical protein J6590_010550 [Homalodisca vitripennis]
MKETRIAQEQLPLLLLAGWLDQTLVEGEGRVNGSLVRSLRSDSTLSASERLLGHCPLSLPTPPPPSQCRGNPFAITSPGVLRSRLSSNCLVIINWCSSDKLSYLFPNTLSSAVLLSIPR